MNKFELGQEVYAVNFQYAYLPSDISMSIKKIKISSISTLRSIGAENLLITYSSGCVRGSKVHFKEQHAHGTFAEAKEALAKIMHAQHEERGKEIMRQLENLKEEPTND